MWSLFIISMLGLAELVLVLAVLVLAVLVWAVVVLVLVVLVLVFAVLLLLLALLVLVVLALVVLVLKAVSLVSGPCWSGCAGACCRSSSSGGFLAFCSSCCLLVLSVEPFGVVLELVRLALVLAAKGGRQVLVELAVQPLHHCLHGLQKNTQENIFFSDNFPQFLRLLFKKKEI